jgi:ABC-2 type transport system permease protein
MSPHDDASTLIRPTPAAGVIHDIGYQRYQGPRLGRAHVVRSAFGHSLRTAFGLGRSARAKILPVGLLALVCTAALVLVAISTRLPAPVLSYVGMADAFAYAATVFVAIVGPELVSRDLRNSVLPLYFSRPLTRTDYALTKLAALAAAVFLLLAAPMLIMFLGMAFNSHTGLAGVADQGGQFLLGLLSAALHAVLFAALAVPLAALTGRRVFATGMVIALFLLTEPISGVLGVIGSPTVAGLAGLLNPVSLLNGLDTWLFGAPFGNVGGYGPAYGVEFLVVAAVGIGLSVLRYRKVKS